MINHNFCPYTIACVTRTFGFEPWPNGYHQDAETSAE